MGVKTLGEFGEGTEFVEEKMKPLSLKSVVISLAQVGTLRDALYGEEDNWTEAVDQLVEQARYILDELEVQW